MNNIKINSWNETDPLRTILFGNIDNSYNIPVEFPCKVRSFDTCKNNNKMNQKQIDHANYLRNNLKNILQNDYSIKVISLIHNSKII